MNFEQLERKLLETARLTPPDERVPYAFEKRIMAGLRKPRPADLWSAWNRVLWQAAVPCVAVMLAVGAWSWMAWDGGTTGTELAADLESAVYAPFASLGDSW